MPQTPFFCLADYEAHAQAQLEPGVAAYLFGGSADEITMRANRAAFDRVAIVPRVLRDLRAMSTRTNFLGCNFAMPVIAAPMGYLDLFHGDGEIGMARATAALDAGFTLSTLSSRSIDDVAAAGEGRPQFFQLYFQSTRNETLTLLRKAEAAKFRALFVTVDATISGIRNREMRAGFRLPDHIRAVNISAGPSLTIAETFQAAPIWADIAWLRVHTSLPIVLKGIMHPDDALRAIELGCNGVVVSNHGGRTLDTAPASLDMLPSIVQAVGSQTTIFLDGGIRRGTDIFKALALGAHGALVGRPLAAALAVAGAAGVAHAIRILGDELMVAMALSGCSNIEALAGAQLIREQR